METKTATWQEQFSDWLINNLHITSKSNVELIVKHVEHYYVHPAPLSTDITNTIKEDAEKYADNKERAGCAHYNGLLLGYIDGASAMYNLLSPQIQEQFWTDEKVKQFAEGYRFSSSRLSIEQFKNNQSFPPRDAAAEQYEEAIEEGKMVQLLKSKDNKIESQQKEIERLKGLIEKAYIDGYRFSYNGYPLSEKINQFKTANNL